MEYILMLPILFFCGLYVSSHNMQPIEEIILGAVLILGIIALVFIRKKRLKYRCKNCKKNWALKLAETKLIGKEDISILVELKSRDSSGEVTGTSEQYIPGTRRKYKSIHQCRYCGHKEIRAYNIDKKKI